MRPMVRSLGWSNAARVGGALATIVAAVALATLLPAPWRELGLMGAWVVAAALSQGSPPWRRTALRLPLLCLGLLLGGLSLVGLYQVGAHSVPWLLFWPCLALAAAIDRPSWRAVAHTLEVPILLALAIVRPALIAGGALGESLGWTGPLPALSMALALCAPFGWWARWAWRARAGQAGRTRPR